MPTTTFYSTKRNANVAIPNNKVCGYRMSNAWMKKGYSDGVKAGIDNGVVNQKFSRFATEQQREEAGSSCAGNTNWINHRKGENFNPPESAKNQFNIDRKAFKAGSIFKETKVAESISGINRRMGQGNYEMLRPAFMAPAIHARLPIDFDKLQAMDIANFGQKVQLSGEQLEQLTMVSVPDPLDTQWLEEKRRRVASLRSMGMDPIQIKRELEVNKPLGREQRTIKKKSKDVAREVDATAAAKLNALINQVVSGNAENRLQQAQITGQIALVLNDTNSIENITSTQLNGLGIALARLGVPTTAKALGISERFVDNAFYLANAGMINLMLFSKVREGNSPALYNYSKLVKNFATEPDTGLPLGPGDTGAMKLNSFISSLTRPLPNTRYLDLERGGVISVEQLRQFAAADALGYAGPNFSIVVPPP